MQSEGLSAEALALDVTDVTATRRPRGRAALSTSWSTAPASPGTATATDTTPEDFDAVTAANVRGAYFLAQAVARGLITAGRPGSIITISSQMGHVGAFDRAVYCATKHAVEGFTKAMAIDWGAHGIRVNTIGPTFIRTPLTEVTFANPERLAWIESRIKLGRVGRVEDIMGAVVYLASDASAMVTGTSLLVDGGWTAD